MSKILLVEDDKVLLEMYKDKFAHEGFSVQTASDGQEALDKMKQFHPDAVLLDLLIPKITGFDVLTRAKSDPDLHEIPILVLTNIFADAEDLVKNKGAEHVLLKSNFTPEAIVLKVQEVLKNKA